jgi:2-keto-4-pentenoate hydratase
MSEQGNTRRFKDMSHTTPLQGIAQSLVAARRSGRPCAIATTHPDLSLDEAYAVQAEVARQMGWFTQEPRAWKVGGAPVITAAPLPQVLSSPATWSLAGQHEVLIEAELAFRLDRTPTGPQDVLSCLSTVCVSIELIGTRLLDGLNAPAHWKLADQGVHARLVIGPETPHAACAHFTDEHWRQQACEVTVNGRLVKQVQGSHPSINPLSTLPWLVTHAAGRDMALQAGDVITTGAWAMLRVQAGDRVVVSFEGFGAVQLQITA